MKKGFLLQYTNLSPSGLTLTSRVMVTKRDLLITLLKRWSVQGYKYVLTADDIIYNNEVEAEAIQKGTPYYFGEQDFVLNW
jgi:hypothetical protein